MKAFWAMVTVAELGCLGVVPALLAGSPFWGAVVLLIASVAFLGMCIEIRRRW